MAHITFREKSPVLKVLLIAGMLFHLLLDGGVSNKIIIIMKKSCLYSTFHIQREVSSSKGFANSRYAFSPST